MDDLLYEIETEITRMLIEQDFKDKKASEKEKIVISKVDYLKTQIKFIKFIKKCFTK